MVGLADIPIVGKLVERISDKAVDAVFRGFRYVFRYRSLVNQLNTETEKLDTEKEKMSRKVMEEEANGKIIELHVLKWQKDVEEIQKSDREFSPSCSCIQRLPIPNPVNRFRMGRNASRKAIAIAQLTITGKDQLTGGIAHLPPFENIPKSDTAFEEFESRKDVYKKLWDVLVNEDSPLTHGIYGMAGVGKTRMMEKIWEDAMEKKIFDKVVRVIVGSEYLDEYKLQDQIAGRLNCTLESEDVERRASQLENSLIKGGKVLFILDDVWREIRLDHIIGTSFGDCSRSKGSKILLTSREKDVCLLNKCKYLVEIKTLSHDEALYLFKNAVGPDTINSLPDEFLVREVCDKCGHLPLLIHAVGKALKGKPHNSWKDAHDQLKKGKFEKIVGVEPQVYTCIKLSIDMLKQDDAKSCLFLCSLFPEDANIDMKMLIQLATGSQLIPDGESRILAMVHYLKISSLLLDFGEYHETKVHDVIRDVARSTALTDSRYAFLQVTCNSGYLPSNANYPTRKLLRLDVKTDDLHFYEDLVCPDLHTLWLQSNEHPQQFSGGFFRMFMNLSFLMLENVNLSLEQFSLQALSNLGTLSLSKCDIRKTDVSLFPKNLKTLCIGFCDLPRPLDVANLKFLRKLEIQQREPTWVMGSNVISSLSSLEELHVPNGFINDGEEYYTESIVMEISKLTHLTSLHFLFHDDNTFQGTTNILSNIDRYNIYVGAPKASSLLERGSRVPLRRSIELYGNHSQSWEVVMARAEEVRLGYSGVEISSIRSGYRRAFEDLERLYITKCDNMRHLARISQDEIQYSLQHGATCFSKLTILQITHCSALKYLFCNNIAKSLVQLQELGVYYCYSMEAIIMNEGTSDGKIINFPKLKSLTISYIFRLASFYAKKKYMHSGSTLSMDSSAQYQALFDGAAAFPSLEELNIKGLPCASVVWGKDCYNDTLSSFCKLKILRVHQCHKLEIVIPQAMLHRLNNLEYIKVSECSSLRTMFPPSGASHLTHLKELSVENCWEMREIIETGEQVITDGILFPELTYLGLLRLPSLTTFWCYHSGKDYTCKVPLILPRLSSVVLKYLHDLKSFFHGANFEFQMPALEQVEVCWCGLSTLFTFPIFRKFQLKKLVVRNCELLENIIEDLRGDETSDKIITLFQLTSVEFENLPNLKFFFHNANYEFHMPLLTRVLVRTCVFPNTLFKRSVFKNLEKLEVSHCELLEGIFEDVRGDETSDFSDRIITLSRLSSLLLYDLPKLKRIMSALCQL
ncbi:NB-ARC domain-containing protein [Heracleum sosnowskyi]|uniref:NB-ARC domain-containing protein n=1 Tax=Heracleum sosnowskyi TaxID=360622 RepID=A0AAD8IUC7_9APIA|nr:NB-ARC domain-containing protein [Heracleum sosnowskyi]